ncbi:MAG: SpoIIE family protein phosphatase, partial [Bacteroidales bacterium]|nr:SpoIIE family protein phosphatase [Bacteroidales bacterium]
QNKINTTEFSKMLELLSENDDRVISSFSLYYKSEHSMNRNNLRYHFYKNGLDQEELVSKYESRLIGWAEALQVKNKPFWTEPYKEDETGELTTAYLVPAFISYNDSTPLKGLIGVEFRLQWLSKVIETKKVYNYDYVFVLSKEGKPVIRPGVVYNDDIDIFQVAKNLNNPEIVVLAEKMMAGESGSMEMGGVFQEMKSVLYFMPVTSTNWSVAVVFPKKDLFRNLYTTTLKLGITGILGVLLILLAVIFTTRRMTLPLQKLSISAMEIGKGNLNVEIPELKTNDEVSALSDSINTMQKELQVYIKNLVNTEKYKDRIENELKVAQEIQMGYLRKDFEAFSESQTFSLMAEIKPARQIGGDFYDYFMINDTELCFAIGDVAGKGVPAALTMAIVLTLTRSGNYTKDSLNMVVEKMNNTLVMQNENAVFTTFFIAILDIKTGNLEFCNAGHNYPYLIKGDELFEMKATHGPALGVVDGVHYKSGKIRLETGSKLLLYTDGVTDAENSANEFFTKERLELALTENPGKEISDISKGLIRQLKKFIGTTSQSDDITVMALHYKGIGNGV